MVLVARQPGHRVRVLEVEKTDRARLNLYIRKLLSLRKRSDFESLCRQFAHDELCLRVVLQTQTGLHLQPLLSGAFKEQGREKLEDDVEGEEQCARDKDSGQVLHELVTLLVFCAFIGLHRHHQVAAVEREYNGEESVKWDENRVACEALVE